MVQTKDNILIKIYPLKTLFIKGLLLINFILFALINSFCQTTYPLQINIFDNDTCIIPVKTINKTFNDTLSRNLFITKTINELITQNYYNINYNSKKENVNILKINVYKNKKFQGINIINKNELIDELKHQKNRTFNNYPNTLMPKKFTNLVQKLLNYYENKGFPFVAIQTGNIKCDDSLCMLTININKGNQYVFDSIIIQDSKVIDKYFIDKTLKFKRNEYYQQKKIDNIQQVINNIPFLYTENKANLTFQQNKFTIKLDIKEKKSNAIDGIIGFYSDEKSEKIRLTGNIKITLINSLKTGELIDLQWQSFAAQSQQLNVMAMLPFFLKTDFGISGKLELLKKDTSFSASTKRLGAQYQFSYWNYIQLYLESSESAVTGDFSNSVNNTDKAFYNYYTLLLGSELKYETTNNRLCPTKGYSVTFDIANGLKNKQLKKEQFAYNIDSNQLQAPYRKLFCNIDSYIPISNKNIIKISNNSGWIIDQNLAENELFRVGGFKTLRGFDEQSIWTSAYTIFSLEYRYIFEKNSYFNIFSDAGYCEINTYKTFKILLPLGTGVGINFETQLGIFGLYYAIGKQNHQPFLLKNAKIHFGLSSKF